MAPKQTVDFFPGPRALNCYSQPLGRDAALHRRKLSQSPNRSRGPAGRGADRLKRMGQRKTLARSPGGPVAQNQYRTQRDPRQWRPSAAELSAARSCHLVVVAGSLASWSEREGEGEREDPKIQGGGGQRAISCTSSGGARNLFFEPRLPAQLGRRLRADATDGCGQAIGPFSLSSGGGCATN